MPETSGLPPRADVVIVGAGSAGCVLAERLSRGGVRSVLLLEQGPAWPGAAIRDLRRLPIDATSDFATIHPASAGQVVVRGRGLGGSAAVNGGYFLRWHPDDFDQWPAGWGLPEIERAYLELDGPGGTMGVHPFGESDLGALGVAFERFWASRVSVRDIHRRWPIVGLNRVLGNNVAGLRMTSAQAYLRPALARRDLTVVTGSRVTELTTAGGSVTGVRTDTGTVGCGEVILCAGTLGTAGVLLRSAPEVLGPAVGGLRVSEHREVLVGYRRRVTDALHPLLPTVVHTRDGIEIRCYSDDFARYTSAGAGDHPVIGVGGMRPGGSGEVTLGADGRVGLHLDDLDDRASRPLWTAAAEVTDMLSSAEFAGVVAPGSVAVDPTIRASQHAWGSMRMGVATDWLGGVCGVQGLRIVDGSILPTAGRSGPHATIMMMACRIGDVLTGG